MAWEYLFVYHQLLCVNEEIKLIDMKITIDEKMSLPLIHNRENVTDYNILHLFTNSCRV